MAYYTSYNTTNYGSYTITYNTTSSSTWNKVFKWKNPDEDKQNGDLLHRLNQHDPFECDEEKRIRFHRQIWG